MIRGRCLPASACECPFLRCATELMGSDDWVVVWRCERDLGGFLKVILGTLTTDDIDQYTSLKYIFDIKWFCSKQVLDN